MATTNPTQSPQPTIVKYVYEERSGIRQLNLSRHAIGYVIRGALHIYDGDRQQQISRGDVFYLGAGLHYTEQVPGQDKQFEQIVYFYTSDHLSRILSNLNMTYGLTIDNDMRCPDCMKGEFSACQAWNTIRHFFVASDNYLREGLFPPDETACRIKMTELIYIILTQGNCCLKNKVLGGADTLRESFEQMMRSHIFSDISIEQLARKTNRSMTAFKMEFRRHFDIPPHRWFIRQRLQQSRLLLISTDKLVSQIGDECFFRNTSHFIKLFRKEFGQTPANFRNAKRVAG
jgi:AraC-like DNA-binding protein